MPRSPTIRTHPRAPHVSNWGPGRARGRADIARAHALQRAFDVEPDHAVVDAGVAPRGDRLVDPVEGDRVRLLGVRRQARAIDPGVDLEILLQRAGRLVSKDQLVERLCEWGEEVSNNAIEVYIHRLRKKIEHGPVRIATVRGLGYCLEKIAA